MGKARFKASYDLIRQALEMPMGAQILAITPVDPRTCMILVEHIELPEKPIIEIEPIIHAVKWDWNLPKE